MVEQSRVVVQGHDAGGSEQLGCVVDDLAKVVGDGACIDALERQQRLSAVAVSEACDALEALLRQRFERWQDGGVDKDDRVDMGPLGHC